MQGIELTITFNRYFYLRNQKLAWSLTVGAVATGYIIYGAVTVLVLAVGLSVDRKGGPPIISLAGLIMLISILVKLWGIYSARKAFFKKTADFAAQCQENETLQIFRFTDFGVEYEDPFSTSQLSWELFDPITVVKDSLVLRTKADEEIYLILWLDEIGSAKYNEIKDFLTKKLDTDG